ncbi:hypothetical protein SAMN05444166_2609 [Singulisphaera sp. GP187]|nr:hypothetical protein SAMN05444166_2609 [Singulisphaera sp. GP187]
MHMSTSSLTPAQVFRYAVLAFQPHLKLSMPRGSPPQGSISSLTDTCQRLRGVPDEHVVAIRSDPRAGRRGEWWQSELCPPAGNLERLHFTCMTILPRSRSKAEENGRARGRGVLREPASPPWDHWLRGP